MSCNLTAGIPVGCDKGPGGVLKFIIATQTDISGITASSGDTGIIDNIIMVGSANFYEFIPNKNSSDYVQTIQGNVENGSIGYEQTITMKFGKNEQTKRNTVMLLGSTRVVIIVEDRNGKYWLMGEKSGCDLTGGTSGSGKAISDMNGWELIFTSTEPLPAREVSSTIISGLLS